MNLKFTNALNALNKALAEGEEFPDAAYRVAEAHKVNQMELERCYDEQNLSPRYQNGEGE